jgi:hypothetical protein
VITIVFSHKRETRVKERERERGKERGRGNKRESNEKIKGNVGSHRRRYKPRGSFDLSTGRGK